MKYRTFVQSLRRLYENGRLSAEKITELLEKHRITEDEFNFIVGEDA